MIDVVLEEMSYRELLCCEMSEVCACGMGWVMCVALRYGFVPYGIPVCIFIIITFIL